MQLNQSIYTVRSEKGAFKFDFSKENPCKGILMLEVTPLKSTDKLILNGDSENLITRQNPFKIECSYPIVGGKVLHFTPQNGSKMQFSIVNFLQVK